MNFKTTFFLLLLLVFVGGFLIWDKDHPEVSLDDLTRDSGPRTLLKTEEFPVDKVASVTIAKATETITITKEGDNWFQTQPVRFKLNNWSAKRVGDEVAALEYAETITPNAELSLSDAQLDEPLATVTVTFTGEQAPVKLLLGGKVVGGRGYLMVDDDPKVYVVNDSLHKMVLDDHVRQWRNKSLIAPTEGQAQSLVKTDEQGQITLIKAEGRWVFGGSDAGRVSREAVSNLLGGINGIYIEEFIEDNPKNLAVFGLNQPAVRVTVTELGADDQVRTQSLLIGSPVDLKQETFFAMWVNGGGISGSDSGGAVFTIKKSDRDKFGKAVDDLRDPKLTLLDAGDVTAITIERLDGDSQKQVLNLERGPEGWSFSEPKPAFDIDQEQAQSLLSVILDAKAQSYVPLTKGDEWVATITLTATGRPQPDVLNLFADTQGYLVRSNQETTGYRVAGEALARVFEPVLALRNRQVNEMAVDQIQKLTVTLPDKTVLAFTRKDEAWALGGHDGFEAGAFDDLLYAVSSLKADKWVESPPVKVTQSPYQVLLEADGRSFSFSVDVPSRIATVSEGLFVIAEDVIRKLTAELRARTVLDVARTDVKSVTWQSSGKKVTLSLQAGQYVDSEGRAVDEAAVGALVDTLAGLRVERFVKPKKMKILTTLKVVTASGAYLLELGTQYARLGETYFVLSSEDLGKLTAPVLK